MTSLKRRLLLSTLIGSVILTLATGLFLSIVFSMAIEKQFDQRLENTLAQLVAATRVDEKISLNLDTKLPEYSTLYSGWYWQIVENGQTIFKSNSLQKSSLYKSFKMPVDVGNNDVFRGDLQGPIQQSIRIYAQYISFPELEGRLLYIVSGNSQKLIEQKQSFYWMIVMGLSFLVMGLTLATFFQLRFVLKPLVSLKNYLAKIRVGEGKAIEGDLPQELMPVVNEINSLIDANEKVITRARTHVGNLAHALKTPVSVLLNVTDKKTDKNSKLIKQQVELMNVQITHHLNRARMVASLDTVATKIHVLPTVNSIVNALLKIHFDKSVNVTLELNEGLCFHGEKQDLEELVGNLIDNAFKWCKTQILITVSAVENDFKIMKLYISVEDDGKFMPQEELEKVLKRGHRIDEDITGTGLGLSIVKELAELYNGEFNLKRSKLGGLKTELWLPLA